MTLTAFEVTSLPPFQSPLWWVRRLTAMVYARQPYLAFYDRYYRGNHDLPWLPYQAQEEFRRILKMARANYMGLVVDAKAERIQVEGFRVGDSETADDNLWRIFQANNLDSDMDQAFLESFICGTSYVLVAPSSDPATPLVTVEHPSQCIVEYVPGTNRRVAAAGLKTWVDSWTGRINATLYLPGSVHKYVSGAVGIVTSANVALGLGDLPLAGSQPYALQQKVPTAMVDWQLRDGDGPAEFVNVLGAVPLVELPNNPRLMTGGRSELEDLTDIQDRINKTLADRLMTQDFGAFPQKWATGYPEEDDTGQAVAKINVGRDRMVTTDVEATHFGQFDAAPLDPYSAAKREDVKDIASRSRTPAQYLLGDMTNLSGDALKASESGLVAAVKSRRRHFGEGIERAMRMAAAMTGTRTDVALETIWADPEFRTEAQTADAAVKKLGAGIATRRQAREDVGYSETQIKRMEAEDAAQASRIGLGDLGALFGNAPAPAL